MRARGAQWSYTRFYDEATLPVHLQELDLLILMGGPMSVNDTAQLPWLEPEKEFVRRAIEQGIPTLGICLGAQLIASALGARVYPNLEKEIGWFPVSAVRENAVQPAPAWGFPPAIPVFHWHGETFDLPPGATRLAFSTACANQAFHLGEQVLGLQFHLETTPVTAAAIIEQCRDELVPGPWVQSETTLLGAAPSLYHNANALLFQLLERLVSARYPAG
nr:gamma-glutamyl-gamma-aminobutyrate hydrolase family protein [Thiocapsa imhoffii]